MNNIKSNDSEEPLIISISSPQGDEPSKMTKEDVWGKFDDNHKMILKGMIVATTGQKCPIFSDILEFKDITVVCKSEEENDVIYWLEFVHGYDCVTKRKKLKDDKVALRSEYQCW